MAPANRAQPQDNSALILTFTFLTAGAAMWFGYPGGLLLPVGLMCAGFLAVPPELTGRKDKYTLRPTPADDRERSKLLAYRRHSSYKSVLFPSAQWLPGWPVRGSWFAAIGAALVSLMFPVTADPFDVLGGIPYLGVAHAVCVFLTVTTMTGYGRMFADETEPRPAATLKTVPKTIPTIVLAVVGVVAGVGVAYGAVEGLSVLMDEFAPAGVHMNGSILVLVGGGLIGLVSVPRIVWNPATRHPWEVRRQARAEWAPRWLNAKREPAPTLVARETVGSATVDTFETEAGISVDEYTKLGASKAAALIGGGVDVTILAAPNVTKDGQPIPGQSHPTRFKVVVRPGGEQPNLLDPMVPTDELELALACAFVRVCERAKITPPITVSSMEAVHAEGSPSALWRLELVPHPGVSMSEVRELGLASQLAAQFGAVGIVQHREDAPGGKALYVGAIGAPDLVCRDEDVKHVVEWTRIEDEWSARWTAAKKTPPPLILNREHVGDAVVDTFEAQAGRGAEEFVKLGSVKAAELVGGGVDVTVLTVPNVSQSGEEIPGSTHPTRFQFVMRPKGAVVDVCDPHVDEAQLRLALACAFAQVCEHTGYKQVRIADIEPIHAPESEVAAWKITTVPDPDLPMTFIREGGLAQQFAAVVGAEGVSQHRAAAYGGEAIYIGALTADNLTIADPGIGEIVSWTFTEDDWNSWWGSAIGTSTNFPVPEMAGHEEHELANGTMIHRQVFSLRLGESLTDYWKTEHKFSNTGLMPGFCATTGFVSPVSRTRDIRGFCLVWTSQGEKPPPNSPSELAPSRSRTGDLWLLSGLINHAFDDAKLSRPEVIAVRPLTTPDSNGHVWKIDMLLYDGVTVQDVQAKTSKLLTSLKMPWLRIAESTSISGNLTGLTLYVGANPEGVTLQRERRDRATIVSLDWSQAFADSKLRGSNGAVPKLVATETLPANDKVRQIDFELPPGVDLHRARGAISKLQTATGNGFIEISQHPNSAKLIRMLVCEVDPMPTMVEYPFDHPMDENGDIIMGARVDGSTAALSWSGAAHLLITGGSGSGKTVTAMALMYGALAQGCDIMLIDKQKQGADFKFVQRHALAFCTTVEDARAGLEAAYAEVQRRAMLNGQYGVDSSMKLPPEIRPKRLVVFIDEFTGLILAGAKPPSKPEDNQDAELARLEAVAEYENKVRIAFLAGRILAEARSACVNLVLMTQKMTANSLPPSMDSAKTNLARIFQGKGTYGDLASALKDPQNAPQLGEVVPRGRAIYESNVDRSIMVQMAFAPQEDFERAIDAKIPIPETKIDLEQFRPPPMSMAVEGEEIDMELMESQPLMVDMDFTLTDGPAADEDEIPEWARDMLVAQPQSPAPGEADTGDDGLESLVLEEVVTDEADISVDVPPHPDSPPHPQPDGTSPVEELSGSGVVLDDRPACELGDSESAVFLDVVCLPHDREVADALVGLGRPMVWLTSESEERCREVEREYGWPRFDCAGEPTAESCIAVLEYHPYLQSAVYCGAEEGAALTVARTLDEAGVEVGVLVPETGALTVEDVQMVGARFTPTDDTLEGEHVGVETEPVSVAQVPDASGAVDREVESRSTEPRSEVAQDDSSPFGEVASEPAGQAPDSDDDVFGEVASRSPVRRRPRRRPARRINHEEDFSF